MARLLIDGENLHLSLKGIRGESCAVYHRRTAVVVYLRDEAFERLIVTCDEPEQIAQRLNVGTKPN